MHHKVVKYILIFLDRYDKNSISNVPASCFVNLTQLEEISLPQNGISSIEDFSFSGVPTVTRIGLNFNQLTAITKNMFSGAYGLKWLNLYRNSISEIESGSFQVRHYILIKITLNENSVTLSHPPECYLPCWYSCPKDFLRFTTNRQTEAGSEITEFPVVRETQKHCPKPIFLQGFPKGHPVKIKILCLHSESLNIFGNPNFKGGFRKEAK